MINYKLFCEEVKTKTYYRLNDTDIDIYADEFIEIFKEKFNIDSWYLYNNKFSVSLQYFKKSDVSRENINELRKFMYDKAPYFKDVSVHKDDNRLVLHFNEVGDPLKFKFFY
jgi:hypothetical protein